MPLFGKARALVLALASMACVNSLDNGLGRTPPMGFNTVRVDPTVPRFVCALCPPRCA